MTLAVGLSLSAVAEAAQSDAPVEIICGYAVPDTPFVSSDLVPWGIDDTLVGCYVHGLDPTVTYQVCTRTTSPSPTQWPGWQASEDDGTAGMMCASSTAETPVLALAGFFQTYDPVGSWALDVTITDPAGAQVVAHRWAFTLTP